MRSNLFLIALSSALIYFFFWDSIFFEPIRIYFVAIHESMHGLATLLTGGSIISLNLHGYEGSLISAGGIFPIVSSFGYIGSAIVGSILISSKHKLIALMALNVYVLTILSIYIEHYFSFEFLGAVSISIILLILSFKEKFAEIITLSIGTLLAFESIEDIRNYVLEIPGQTDAGILADYIGLHLLALPIGILFLIITSTIWYFSVKKIILKKN
jgi:hypothetical protein